jgi:hypothetical protein
MPDLVTEVAGDKGFVATAPPGTTGNRRPHTPGCRGGIRLLLTLRNTSLSETAQKPAVLIGCEGMIDEAGGRTD